MRTSRCIPLSVMLLAACAAPQDKARSAAAAAAIVQRASGILGPAGGSVELPDQSAKVVVPPGALAADTNITISAAALGATGGAAAISSRAYAFGPAGQAFLQPVQVRLQTQGTVPAGSKVAWRDPTSQVWRYMLGTAFEGNMAVATVAHFTLFAVVKPPLTGAGCAQQDDPNALCAPRTCDIRANLCVTPAAAPAAVATYALGGTASNLTGPCVLQNSVNGEQVGLAAGQTSFDFPTALPAGGAYATGIVSAPPGQACTLSNPNGLMPAAVRRTIVLTCHTTYTIAGTATGIVGATTLRLQRGGSVSRTQDLRIEQNGAFGYNVAMLAGDSYTLSVIAAPAGQSCRLSGAAGTIVANVGNVSLACGTPRQLSADAANIAGSGRMVITDGQSDNPNSRTFTRTSQSSQSFAHIYFAGDPYTLRLRSYPPTQSCYSHNDQGVFDPADMGVRYTCTTPVSAAMGQVSYATARDGASGQPSAQSLSAPGGPVAVQGATLFAPDSNTGRVLGFSLPALGFPNASFVLGASDLQSAGQLSQPVACEASSDGLLVASGQSVDIFMPLPSASQSAPSQQLTQVGGAGAGCAGLAPRGLGLSGTQVVVGDAGADRVLIYSGGLPLSNAQVPAVVLGGVNGQFCSLGLGAANPNASRLNQPTGVWTNGTLLAVADTGNHRVLLWKSFPVRTNQPADVVLGQPDFVSSAPGSGSAQLASPMGVGGDGSQLYVADTGNNRVLSWYSPSSLSNGQAADTVWGQQNFTQYTCNAPTGGLTAGPQAGAAAPDATTLCAPQGVRYQGGRLWVTDTGNHRVLAH